MRSFRLLILLLLSPLTVSGQPINYYVQYSAYGICSPDLNEVICLRKFMKDSHIYYFTVSPESLRTQLIRSDSISIRPETWEAITERFSASPYIKALKEAEKYSDTIQDAGFTHFMPTQKGIDLTIDLCPSQHPLDRIVFTSLIKELGRTEKPVPLAISVTGRWIKRHPGDLKWLDSLARSGVLSIVWINHSYNHFTNDSLSLKSNFMLAGGTDVNTEVMKTELTLIRKNIVPSVFFRFPGLVSNHTIYEKILNFGLIPIGSDSWLAKGQHPKNGSIVLIHANGNDQLGVSDFIRLLNSKYPEVLAKQWELYDLRKSLTKE